MRWMAIPLIGLVLAGLAYGLWPRGSSPAQGREDAAAVAAALAQAWTDAAEGEPLAADPLRFPRDHGPHPAASAEVWDLSAILNPDTDETSALRLTLVRLALQPQGATDETAAAAADGHPVASRASAFAAAQVVAGQWTLTTETPSASLQAARISRVALGLAGARSEAGGQGRIWLAHWELVREDGRFRVRADGDGTELMLELSPSKAPLALTETLLDEAPPAAAAALRGYSEPRMRVSGTLVVAGERRAVHGSAWLEHAWGALGAALSGGRGQLIANRFRLQLDDGLDLSCLHLRRRGGGGTPIPSCALIDVDGERVLLGRRELILQATQEGWAAAGAGRYPLGWRLLIPSRELELELTPLQADPATAVRPLASVGAGPGWSGAVRVSGWRGADAITGLGFMDLSGYGEAGAGT